MWSVLSLVFFLEKSVFLSWEKKLNPKALIPLFVFLLFMWEGRDCQSFFLSNDGFISYHYFSSVATSICHLLGCYFSKMGRLTSDTELINEDIIAVMYFRLTLCELRLWSTQPACLLLPFKWLFAEVRDLHLPRTRSLPDVQVAVRSLF